MKSNSIINSIMSYFETGSGLRILFALQLVCVLFFVVDAIRHAFSLPEKIGPIDLEVFEFLVVAVMVFSMILTARQLMVSKSKTKQLQDKLQAASGEFNAMLLDCFSNWQLTNSERDVALLAIKGFGIADISRMRETKEGTIKAQLNAIYRKANVSGRPQLISYFVEELMTGDFQIERSEPTNS